MERPREPPDLAMSEVGTRKIDYFFSLNTAKTRFYCLLKPIQIESLPQSGLQQRREFMRIAKGVTRMLDTKAGPTKRDQRPRRREGHHECARVYQCETAWVGLRMYVIPCVCVCFLNLTTCVSRNKFVGAAGDI